MLGDDVAQEAVGGAAELALGRFGVELVMPQRLEHHPHVHEVLFARLGEDEDVVAVHLHEAAEHGRAGAWPGPASSIEGQDRAAKNGVHLPHEDRRHAMQAEGANPELILAARHAEGGLELVLLADAELHVCTLEVQLGEKAGAPGLVNELLNVWQGLHRALRDGVEAAVVLAEAPRAVRLAGEDDGGCMGGTRH